MLAKVVNSETQGKMWLAGPRLELLIITLLRGSLALYSNAPLCDLSVVCPRHHYNVTLLTCHFAQNYHISCL